MTTKIILYHREVHWLFHRKELEPEDELFIFLLKKSIYFKFANISVMGQVAVTIMLPEHTFKKNPI